MEKTTIWIILAVFGILAAGAVYSITSRDSGPGEFDSFAQCISEAGAVMYGTEWCSHCKAQKEMFGKSFQFVAFVDCDKAKNTCLREGVTGYPTWKFADGSSKSGQTPLPELSRITGCSLY